jgi:hypothetical protein
MVTVTPEELIPRDHPIRVIKKVADEALKRLEPQLSAFYSERGTRMPELARPVEC